MKNDLRITRVYKMIDIVSALKEFHDNDKILDIGYLQSDNTIEAVRRMIQCNALIQDENMKKSISFTTTVNFFINNIDICQLDSEDRCMYKYDLRNISYVDIIKDISSEIPHKIMLGNDLYDSEGLHLVLYSGQYVPQMIIFYLNKQELIEKKMNSFSFTVKCYVAENEVRKNLTDISAGTHIYHNGIIHKNI